MPLGIKSDADIAWMNQIPPTGTLVVGDFNAHHNLWETGRPTACPGGNLLSEQLQNINLCILNDGSVTRFPDKSQGNPSAIDLLMCSPNLFQSMAWNVLDDTLGSDHRLISCIIHNLKPDKTVDTTAAYNYEKADWTTFASTLDNATYPNENLSVEEWYTEFRAIILNAADTAIPKTRSDNHKKISNPWWNEKCKAAQSKYRHFCKIYTKQTNDQTNKLRLDAKRDYQHTINEAKFKVLSQQKFKLCPLKEHRCVVLNLKFYLYILFLQKVINH